MKKYLLSCLLFSLVYQLPAAAADTPSSQNHVSSGTALSREFSGIRLGQSLEELEGQYDSLAARAAARMGMQPAGPEDYETGTRGFELLSSSDERFSTIDFWVTPNTKKIYAIEARFADLNLLLQDLVRTYTTRLGKHTRKECPSPVSSGPCYTWKDSNTTMYLSGEYDKNVAKTLIAMMGSFAAPSVGIVDQSLKKQQTKERQENKKNWEGATKSHLENSLP